MGMASPSPKVDIPGKTTKTEEPGVKSNFSYQISLREQLKEYVKKYNQIPNILITANIEKLRNEAKKALKLPGIQLKNQDVLKHKKFFDTFDQSTELKNISSLEDKQKIEQDKEDMDQLQNINQAVDEAKQLKKEEQENQKGVEYKELRPDVEEGQKVYEGIDKELKQTISQTDFLKEQMKIKDEEINLLKSKINQEKEKNTIDMLEKIAPVFRHLLDIQIQDSFTSNDEDYVDNLF
jgi:hypothetical protein